MYARTPEELQAAVDAATRQYLTGYNDIRRTEQSTVKVDEELISAWENKLVLIAGEKSGKTRIIAVSKETGTSFILKDNPSEEDA